MSYTPMAPCPDDALSSADATRSRAAGASLPLP
uniref:Uncharacterized protein n=1 Tax=Arundo donax TaxID=35708 RepID=A0A0A9HH26_ARUDO